MTQAAVPVEDTLSAMLQAEAVPMAALHARYGSLLELVRRILGVVPNCDPYLEIWPPAFRTYNVMVPNLLNLPLMVWGLGAPRSTLGLAMYVSSRTAGCAYCSAHSCTFALRRGATVDQVASALDSQPALSEADRAAVRVARSLAVVPTTIDDEARAALWRHFSETDAEWVVLAIAMMGWLNKTMDALGVPLEEATASEVSSVIAPSGWTPGQHMQGAVVAGKPPGWMRSRAPAFASASQAAPSRRARAVPRPVRGCRWCQHRSGRPRACCQGRSRSRRGCP